MIISVLGIGNTRVNKREIAFAFVQGIVWWGEMSRKVHKIKI